VNTPSHSASAPQPSARQNGKSSLAALVHRYAATVRARRLYGFGQGIAAERGADARHRAARVYRRALHWLEPELTPPSQHEALRDAVRARLWERGIGGLWSRHPRWIIALAVAAIGLWAATRSPSLFARDLADGKPWAASSSWGPFARMGVMSGDPMPEGRFHTLEEQNPWFMLDLEKVQDVSAVRVDNRLNCCRERAVPLIMELSVDSVHWKRVAYQRAVFASFTATFPTTQARYVRLRVDRRTAFHLLRVAVF
jgi:hypothetical protein